VSGFALGSTGGALGEPLRIVAEQPKKIQQPDSWGVFALFSRVSRCPATTCVVAPEAGLGLSELQNLGVFLQVSEEKQANHPLSSIRSQKQSVFSSGAFSGGGLLISKPSRQSETALQCAFVPIAIEHRFDSDPRLQSKPILLQGFWSRGVQNGHQFSLSVKLG